MGKVKLLWPIHFSSVPLSRPGSASLEPPELGQQLAALGLARFQHYLSSTLPHELAMDPGLAEEFNRTDHSRVNIAFRRWQMRVFAEQAGVPMEELTSRGETTPQLPGVNYSWPELYRSREFKKLKARIAELSRLYMKRSGYAEMPAKFRIFVWVEVYGRGDALRPGSRTDGAYLMGRYWASAKKGSLKLNFEDPRGINPPYGKTYSHSVYEGNIVLYPTWISHFVTPNMHDHTAVCYSFLVYPPDGNTLDWEDDRTGRLEVVKPLH